MSGTTTDQATRIRVLLVDDHEVVRIGLRSFLGQTPDIEVVGEAETAADAVALTQSLQPDVVVLDVRLPDGSGVDACHQIHGLCPQSRVLMLTTFGGDDAVEQAIRAGAAGFLLKQVRGREVAGAIRSVHRGEFPLAPKAAATVVDRLSGGESERPTRERPFARLTEQERRILAWLAEGKTNREIAAISHLSEKTVKHYVSHVLAKLEVGRRSEAAALWARAETDGTDSNA